MKHLVLLLTCRIDFGFSIHITPIDQIGWHAIFDKKQTLGLGFMVWDSVI